MKKKFEQKRLSQDYYPVRTTGSNQPNNVPMSWHLDQCVNFLLLLKWHFHQKIRSQDWSSHWPRSKQSLEKTEVEWSDSTFAVSFHELDGNCINLYSMYFWPSTILTNSTYLSTNYVDFLVYFKIQSSNCSGISLLEILMFLSVSVFVFVF